MTDRELLELAAKAAGIDLIPMEVKNVTQRGEDRFIGYMTNPAQWQKGWFNPLRDGDDALRLVVKLNLIVGVYGSYTNVYLTDASNKEITCWNSSCNNDPYAATRRAIVRAAAEIGRQA